MPECPSKTQARRLGEKLTANSEQVESTCEGNVSDHKDVKVEDWINDPVLCFNALGLAPGRPAARAIDGQERIAAWAVADLFAADGLGLEASASALLYPPALRSLKAF